MVSGRGIPDQSDTIAAIASPPGGAARSIVRIAGPQTRQVVERLLGVSAARHAVRLGNRTVTVTLGDREAAVPVDAFVWPGLRSYTRQPAAELHTVGSPPVAEAVLAAVCQAGARLAERGEFTLRALLAGRIDLTQAEAVLGVIDAEDEQSLQAALGQLAGGLAGPLGRLRDDLADLLAELEAGLDFVDEEDIRFVEPEELLCRLAAARQAVAALADQSTERGVRGRLPRVVLLGPPNAGKSRLYNALVSRFGRAESTGEVVVSSQPGTTRDCLATTLTVGGVSFELIDTAGVGAAAIDAIDALAQTQTETAAADADLLLRCVPVRTEHQGELGDGQVAPVVTVVTKADLATPPPAGLSASAVTGDGVDEVARAAARRLASASEGRTVLVAETAQRCADSLALAADSLAAAEAIAPTGQHELVSCELRSALDELGRVTGAVTTDDLLDRVFSRFCIGK
ncbi:MAG: GTPase [Planctomycetota bacterium]